MSGDAAVFHTQDGNHLSAGKLVSSDRSCSPRRAERTELTAVPQTSIICLNIHLPNMSGESEGSYPCTVESGYRSESGCCAEPRHQCRSHCLSLPPGQKATALMAPNDGLAPHLLPSMTGRVGNVLNSPSIICVCTEAASNKDWWEFPELSDSQSDIADL